MSALASPNLDPPPVPDAYAPGCPLCPPTRGVVRADDLWTLVVNDNGATLGRVFLALRRHETDLLALTPGEASALWARLAEARAALSALFAPDHFNSLALMTLTPHVHVHLFPRYAAPREFAGRTWEDSNFGGHYDPDEARPLDDATMEAMIAALRAKL